MTAPAPAPARLLRELVETVQAVAYEEDEMGQRIVPALAGLIDRAWLVAS